MLLSGKIKTAYLFIFAIAIMLFAPFFTNTAFAVTGSYYYSTFSEIQSRQYAPGNEPEAVVEVGGIDMVFCGTNQSGQLYFKSFIDFGDVAVCDQTAGRTILIVQNQNTMSSGIFGQVGTTASTVNPNASEQATLSNAPQSSGGGGGGSTDPNIPEDARGEFFYLASPQALNTAVIGQAAIRGPNNILYYFCSTNGVFRNLITPTSTPCESNTGIGYEISIDGFPDSVQEGSWTDAGSGYSTIISLVDDEANYDAALVGATLGGEIIPPGATCQNQNNEVSWLLCPVVQGSADSAGGMLGFISDQLEFEVGPADASNGMFRVWNAFKNVANVFFVIAMLFIVYAQATGSMLDAYSVKKMLPRLVIAAIAVQLSFFISSFVVDIFNELGQGLAVMIDNILGIELGLEQIATILLTVIGASVLAIGAAFIGLFAIAPILLGIIITLVGVIFTLAFRGLLITVLVILSPIAFIAWVLPGTERFFSMWWQNFSKALLMYPMIILLIQAGKIMAVAASGGNAQDIGFWGLIYMFAPYLLIPFTFKFAGTSMAAISSYTNKVKGGVQQSSRERSTAEMARRRSEFLSGTRTQGGKFGSLVDKVGMGIGVGSKSITRPSSFKGRMELARQAAAANRAEQQDFQRMSVNSLAMAGNAFGEDFLDRKIEKERAKRAAATTDTERAKIDQSIAAIEQARSLSRTLPKTTAQRQASLMALASSGYEFSPGSAGYTQLSDVVAELAGGSIDESTGMYVGPNAGMYGNLMNEAQYRLKGAGRFDLAGINGGTGFSFDKGLGKADSFTLGRSAIETVTAGREVFGASATAPLTDDELRSKATSHLSSALSSNTEEAQATIKNTMRWRAQLKSAKNSATGVNLEEINKQLSAIDGAINSFASPPGEPVSANAQKLREEMLAGERHVSTYDSEQMARRGGIDPNDPHLEE